MYRQELKFNKITHVCHKKELYSLNVINNEPVHGHVVNLVSFPVNVMFDFSNNLKYGICWNFDHV